MKKLIMLTLLVALTFNAISQKSSDKDSVTCIPNAQLRAAIKALEQKKNLEKQIALYRENIELLLKQGDIKDSALFAYKKIDTAQQNTIKNLLVTIQTNNQQIDLKNKIITSLNKDVSREKRKNIFWKIGSGVVVGLLTYAWISK